MKRKTLLDLALIFFLMPAFAFAQTATTTKISGVVTDAKGSVIAGASVKLTNKATKLEKTASTNNDGLYVFSSIEPGLYDVSVASPGFRSALISDVKADISTGKTVDVALEVGNISEQITISAGSQLQLQRDDASIGNVIDKDRIKRLPNLSRQSSFLLQLQPGTAPVGEVTGSRADQTTFNLDGIDVTDNVVGQPFFTVIPTPNESVEEFRVTIANPNATFGRSAGAQVTLVTKRGTEAVHGSVYEYYQNKNLNANTWTNNRLGIERPPFSDHLFGASVGGPLRKDKLFFFFNYEAERQTSTSEVVRIVPTQSFRNGLLSFRDASGGVFTVNPQAFDPRGLGSNPQILASLKLMPLPNNFSFGDGLNTGGFSANLPSAAHSDFGVLRLDYQLSRNWSFEAKGAAARQIFSGPSQVNLIEMKGLRQFPFRPRNLTFALIGTVRPNLVNELRYGYVYESTAFQSQAPKPLSGFNIAVNLAPGALDIDPNFALLDEPIDVDTMRTTEQISRSGNHQLVDNANWSKGAHNVSFGGTLRRISTFHFRTDKVIGSLATPVAAIGAAGNVQITPTERPPSCGPGVTQGCLQPQDLSRYDQFYASLLGIVDSVSYLAVRDANLKPLPVGTGLVNDTKLHHWEFYLSDVWRLKPSLTLSYGLMYQWHTAPVDSEGRQTVLTYKDTGELIDPQDYLRRKATAAEAGEIFNPDIAYVPVKQAGLNGVFKTYRKDFSPRISLAWQPSFKGGVFGRLLGDRRSVIRGGYGLLYDRVNTVSTVLIPILGVGFGQTLTLRAPTNAAGQPFRAGIDGPIPIPQNFATSSPIVPSKPFGETLSFSVDPNIADPRNHVISFTIQRQLPGKIMVEGGYVGRLARNLFQNVNLNSAPYFFKDKRSSQRFSEAFDAVAAQLRAGASPFAITPQPWFENQINLTGTPFAALGPTRFLAFAFTGDFVTGNLNNIWNLGMDFFTPTPYNNQQSVDLFVRTSLGRSNYHAMFISVHRQAPRGLTFDVNYTLSKSLDQLGQTQGAVSGSPSQFSSSFDPNIDYGPSDFDARHLINMNAVYDLPFGPGRKFSAGNSLNKLIGGWHVGTIFQGQSGFPLTVTQGFQVFGAGAVFGPGTGAIPLGPVDFGNSVHSGVAGSGGVGTAGNPASGGSGLNLFANPEAAFNSFRRVEISKDGRSGRGVLRGFSRWQLDVSLGKTARIREQMKLAVSFDFFNIFNHVNFSDPVLNLNNTSGFGVVTNQLVNSFYRPRIVQISGRFEF
jgi:hypothetical protein